MVSLIEERPEPVVVPLRDLRRASRGETALVATDDDTGRGLVWGSMIGLGCWIVVGAIILGMLG